MVTDATAGEVDSAKDQVERRAPANFSYLLLARTASKVGDRLASPKTTLAWLLQALGAPAIFAGLVVPVRESGSLLPQILFSNYLKRLRLRKWAWSTGALIQGVAIASCAIIALTLQDISAGIAILIAITFFSLARGISSVSAKDVLGKTIPKSKRGQLTGWAASVSGLVTIVATSLFFFRGNNSSIQLYATYLGMAAALWFAAAIVNAVISEEKSEVKKNKSLTDGLKGQFKLICQEAHFRDFLIVRTLAVGSGLSTPYVITLAHQKLDGASMWLGVFIIVEGLAVTIASPLWGKWADHSSRAVLRVAMATVASLLVLIVIHVSTGLFSEYSWLVFPLAFFGLGVAHSGVRVGRKTYIVNMAEGNRRTDYVSIANTLIGVLLLIAGLLAGIVSLIAVPVALSFFAVAALFGSLYGKQLKPLNDN